DARVRVHRPKAMMDDGARKATAENLATTASATQAPSAIDRGQVGSSSQRASANSAPATSAVGPMSVVASDACASTLGFAAKKKSAIAPAASPPSRRAHAHTTQHPSRKKGSSPKRASASVRT